MSTSGDRRSAVAARQFSVTTRAHVAVDDATGEPIGLDDVDTRVGWLLDLIAAAGGELMSRLWQPATFDVLAAGRDLQDRRLPVQGHVAAARLGWHPSYPDGVYVPSRVTRVVTAQVLATLRTLAYRDTAIAALSARFDPATGVVAPPTGSADHVSAGFARGVRRQLIAHARRTGGAAPAGRVRITDLQGPPQTSAMAQLSAADRQLAQITATERELVLTVKLPTSPAPAGREQWRNVRLTANIPAHLRGRAITGWHLPTLILDRRGLLLRCAATEAVPAADMTSGTTAVGVDWSPSTLGAAAITADNPEGLSSDYRGWTYDDRGLGIKLARLQAEGQLLHRKAARLTQLAATAPPEVRAQLEEKIAVLDTHRTAVGIKRGKINRELAFHFARQVTDYAAAQAQIIAVEDLTTLETRGHGRVNNNRAAQSARRQAVTALAHTAAEVGITVVSVPARGSSAQCPGCDEPLARPGGYHNAWCPGCRVGGNRDHVAGVNLAKRALLGKNNVTRRRGQLPAVRVADHAPVRRCRDTNSLTPRRPRHRRVRRSVPTVTPRLGVNPKQHVPAPQASVWDTVKPAPPHGDAGSRDTRLSLTPATQVADSMRFT
ncbi:zinc ribbon domain-containing protein [Rhodococcus sp. NPDC059968]|uniref:zinc ribbon domain-containing protein n=1 Tax=Rhodococcus sp. NPDC059968 TaxID=3347017 RepID=UPI003672D8DE